MLTFGSYRWALPLIFLGKISSSFGRVIGPITQAVAQNGETTIRLTEGGWKDSYAFWSRGGEFIYFNSDRAGASNIYRMLMDGVDCVRAHD